MMYVCTCTCHCACVEIREQLREVGSCLLLHRFWGLDSGDHVCMTSMLFTGPSFWALAHTLILLINSSTQSRIFYLETLLPLCFLLLYPVSFLGLLEGRISIFQASLCSFGPFLPGNSFCRFRVLCVRPSKRKMRENVNSSK